MSKPNDFPEVITLCGSTKFKEQFMEINKKLTLDGCIVLSVGTFGHADKIPLTIEQKNKLDALHLRKIDMSDSIFVIDVDGYIGESTRREIEYSKKNNKKIIYYSQEMKK
jgi:hypothetical protein